MKKLNQTLCLLGGASLLQSASAELINRWTFDTDGSPAVGTIPMNFAANAFVSSACSKIGDGALFISSENAPVPGGAISQGDIDWNGFPNGDVRTVTFWALMAPPQEANATMFSAGGQGNGNRFDIKVSNDNYRVEVQGGGFSTTENVVDDTWHHFAIVIPNDEAVMGDLLYYLDGNLIDTSANNSNRAIDTSTGPLQIGESIINNAVDRDVNGYIDDVRIYDNALTPAEIQALFAEGRILSCFEGTGTILIGESVDLSWKSSASSSLVITNDQDATSIDALAIGANGSVSLSPTTTTTYTITADGGSDSRQLTVNVQPGPDVTLVATPSVTNGTEEVTLFFNATVTTEETELASGILTGFTDDGNPNNGFDVTDVGNDFDTLLAGQGTLFFEVTNGDIVGTITTILSFSGSTLTLADDLANQDISWDSYRVLAFDFGGTDLLEISDGNSVIFSTSDPLLIAGGSFNAGVVSADTTYTATASVSNLGASQDTATVLTSGSGSSYEEVVLSQNPAAYFRFEESFNSTAVYDSSGNGNHSVGIENPFFFTSGNSGVLGNGGTFQEAGDTGASVVTGLTLSTDVDFSISALVQPETLGDNSANIVSNRDGTGVGRSLLFIGQTERPSSFLGEVTTPDPALGGELPLPYIDNAVCHLAMTYDSVNQVVTIYVDGIQVAQRNEVVGEAASGNWVIGAHKANLGDVFWDGIIDEVAIFDTVLTPAQVAAQNSSFLANSGAGILAFGRDTSIAIGESVDLLAKVGAGSAAASIDNGIGPIAIGESNSITVSPTVDTTYTLTVDGQQQSVTITVLPPESITITDCGFDASGNYFIDVAEGVDGFKVTQSTDIASGFTDVLGATNDGNNRFTIPSASLDSDNDGKAFFRIESIAQAPVE